MKNNIIHNEHFWDAPCVHPCSLCQMRRSIPDDLLAAPQPKIPVSAGSEKRDIK